MARCKEGLDVFANTNALQRRIMEAWSTINVLVSQLMNLYVNENLESRILGNKYVYLGLVSFSSLQHRSIRPMNF